MERTYDQHVSIITINSNDQQRQCHAVFTVTCCRRRMVDLGLVFLCSCGIGAMHRGSMGANSADFPGSLPKMAMAFFFPGWRGSQDKLLGGRSWSWSHVVRLCCMDFESEFKSIVHGLALQCFVTALHFFLPGSSIPTFPANG